MSERTDSENLERIADALERLVIAADQFATAQALAMMQRVQPPEPMAYCPSCNAPEFWSVRPEPGDQVKCANCQQVHAFPFYTAPKRGKYPPDNLADYGAPIGAPIPHSFARVPDNRFCGECGGGKLHPIHHAGKLRCQKCGRILEPGQHCTHAEVIDPQTQIQLDPGLSDYLSNKAIKPEPESHYTAAGGWTPEGIAEQERRRQVAEDPVPEGIDNSHCCEYPTPCGCKIARPEDAT